MNRLLEPVFLFLTCQIASVSGLCKVWRGKIPQRSEDDFSTANPNGLDLAQSKGTGLPLQVRNGNAGWIFVNLEGKYFVEFLMRFWLNQRLFVYLYLNLRCEKTKRNSEVR